MTPEQLAELKTAWPGDWRKTSDGGAYQYELPPLPSRWEPTAGTIAWASTSTVVLRLRRPGHKTFAAEGATFAVARAKLTATVDRYIVELRGLAVEARGARGMTPERLAELHAAWPGPWRKVADQDEDADDYELPPDAAGWTARAGIAPGGGHAVLIVFRPGHEPLAWTAETFTACAKAIRAKLTAEGYV